MAKKSKKAAKRSATRPSAKGTGFKTLAMHVTEASGRRTFEALRDERPTAATFGIAASQPENLDPESAAKRILEHALASDAAPNLTAPKARGMVSDFRSLGVETVPLTGTSIVKFRQQLRGIPVYGSLISVELDDANEMVSLNSNLATPDVASTVARVSPHDALKRVASEAGYGRELPDVTPVLNFYLDARNKWHLAYLVENIRSRKKDKKHGGEHGLPLVYDYVIDALTGALVAELPRTPAMANANDSGIDEFGASQTFAVEVTGGKKAMRNAALNIETFDFRFRDPEVLGTSLPGTLSTAPWTKAAVSAHVNATVVATFLRDVLKRNNVDNKGGRLISTVNCVVKRDERPAGSKNWLNAFWDGKQMVYGQVTYNGALRSLAASLDVVAHELFHGVTAATARLVYQAEPGALNESYSDIFGIFVSNLAEPDIGKWNWLIGDGISNSLEALRDMRDPTRFGQPKLMKNYKKSANTLAGDFGGVHINSGIHNFAAYNVMTAQVGGKYLFRPAELAAMFYVALTQQLSRQSTFSDSRRGVTLATRSLFRALPQAELETRARAVEAGFDAAGIK
jgi:Zn-dependent metalloprotease